MPVFSSGDRISTADYNLKRVEQSSGDSLALQDLLRSSRFLLCVPNHFVDYWPSFDGDDVEARKSFGKRFEVVRILQALGLLVEGKNWITKGLQDVEKSLSAADELP